jgi:5-methylcytosine-specific restriction endonuclease McrA
LSNYVLVIDSNKKPCDPVKPGYARMLLKLGKAAVFRRYPFTLILKREVEKQSMDYELKLDPGSKQTGIALVREDGLVVFGAELEHRGQAIKGAMMERKAVRNSRRKRKVRYRSARFLNRTKPKGWLAPSLKHRVLTTMTWINRLVKFSPVASFAQELVKFDTQKMQNPDVSGVTYQHGTLHEYEVKEYLLEKWGRKCVYCGKKDISLEVEHIVARVNGGSDRVSNLTLVASQLNNFWQRSQSFWLTSIVFENCR